MKMRALICGAMCFALGCAGDDGGEGPFCGDAVCSAGETSSTCTADCPVGGPFCGDNTCNGNETASTCAADCSTTACSTSPDNCTAETICISGKCEPAFPRVYRITNVSVMVPTSNPNNNSDWDVGGGAPDLYLGDQQGTPISSAVQNQFSATFPGPLEVQLVAGTALRIDAWDEDVSVPDYAFGCQANPITAAQLRARAFGCAANGGSLNSVITPK